MCACDWDFRCTRCRQAPWADGGEQDRAAEQTPPWDAEPSEERDRAAHVTRDVGEDW
jgi:hypothetical protein